MTALLSLIYLFTLIVVCGLILSPDALPEPLLDGHVAALALVGPEEGRLGAEDDWSVVPVDGDARHVRHQHLPETVLRLLDKEEHPAGRVDVDIHAQFVTLLKNVVNDNDSSVIIKLCVDIIYLEQAGDETHLQLVGQPHVLTGPGLTRQLDVSTISI